MSVPLGELFEFGVMANSEGPDSDAPAVKQKHEGPKTCGFGPRDPGAGPGSVPTMESHGQEIRGETTCRSRG